MKIDKNLALFYGVLLGDGCLGRYDGQYVIAVTGNLKDDIPFYDNILIPLISKLRGKQTKYRIGTKGNRIDFHFYDKKFLLEINSLGFPIGKKGPDIMIPKIFYDKNLIKYVVQGIMSTDGSLVWTMNPNNSHRNAKLYPRIELYITHKKLLEQVYLYLSSQGMQGCVYDVKRKPTWKIQQPRYRFQFNGYGNLTLYEEKVGFVNQKQIDKYGKIMDKWR